MTSTYFDFWFLVSGIDYHKYRQKNMRIKSNYT